MRVPRESRVPGAFWYCRPMITSSAPWALDRATPSLGRDVDQGRPAHRVGVAGDVGAARRQGHVQAELVEQAPLLRQVRAPELHRVGPGQLIADLARPGGRSRGASRFGTAARRQSADRRQPTCTEGTDAADGDGSADS